MKAVKNIELRILIGGFAASARSFRRLSISFRLLIVYSWLGATSKINRPSVVTEDGKAKRQRHSFSRCKFLMSLAHLQFVLEINSYDSRCI